MKANSRHLARRFAVQALYQWQLAGGQTADILAQFLADEDFSKAETAYFTDLVTQVLSRVAELDELLTPVLDRSLNSVDPVERAILRLSAYELSQRLEIPYRVCINEGIELSKVFGATEGHKFVNGVLDRLALRLRPAEIQKKAR